MLNILVIEDQAIALEFCCETIQTILEDCCIYKARSAESAIIIMGEQPIDVFFIDIDLPGISGVDLARRIRQDAKHELAYIVFVTGKEMNEAALHKQYHHYEYITKPFSVESFVATVGPLLTGLDRIARDKKNALDYNKETERYVAVRGENSDLYINLSTVLYVEAEKRGICVVTSEQRHSKIRMPLELFINQFDSPYFVRCHKSYAVNLKQVSGMRIYGRRLWIVEFREGTEAQCLVSSMYYRKVKALLDEEMHGGE